MTPEPDTRPEPAPEPDTRPEPAPARTVRQRELRLGRGIASVAYNRLVTLLQDPKAKVSPEVLARLLQVGAHIALAAHELPDDGADAEEDLERVAELLGFAPPTQ